MSRVSQDLNFLYLVDALYREGSVSAAAASLGLSQPAASHALNRLRRRFGDQLFVRAGMGVTATPLGEKIALGARRSLDYIESEILAEPEFDPATAARTFTVAMTDMGGTVILPKVVHMLQHEAPNIHIKPVVAPPTEVGQLLDENQSDLAWGYFDQLGPGLYQQNLFRRALVGIQRKRDAHRPMSLDTFIETPHVLATATAGTNMLLQRRLRERGHVLHVALECPYILAVPAIVSGTGYIATVPDELADLFLQLADIEMFELPLDIPDITVNQYWHARFNDDAGHRWFRASVSACQ